tara:strand:- start:333 stop:866 length:534 start_codon:yes stop_codon:yes gene_type:complete
MIYSKNKNIGIRSIEFDDLSIIQKWRNNENIRKYFREYREFSLSQKQTWYEKMLSDNNFEMFVIIDCNADEIIGVTGLTYIDWINRHADVHFYIGKNELWIDEEYSPDAFSIILKYGFEILNLNKIWAEVYEIDNLKLSFLKNYNFQIDASLREHYFFEGNYYTSHILSLLKSEYIR